MLPKMSFLTTGLRLSSSFSLPNWIQPCLKILWVWLINIVENFDKDISDITKSNIFWLSISLYSTYSIKFWEITPELSSWVLIKLIFDIIYVRIFTLQFIRNVRILIQMVHIVKYHTFFTEYWSVSSDCFILIDSKSSAEWYCLMINHLFLAKYFNVSKTLNKAFELSL